MNETPETALRRALAMIEPESVRTSARIDGGYVELSQRAEFTGRPIPPGDPGIVVP